jgi:O-antigen ligase
LADKYEMVDQSTFIRLKLIGAGMEMAGRTLMVGVGAGSYPSYIVDTGLLGTTYGIVDPHNAFIRVFGENGIIGLGLLVAVIFGPVIAVARASRVTRFGPFVLASVAIAPLLFTIGSDPLSSSTLQLFVAMIWVGTRFVSEPPTDVALTS